MSLTRVSQLFNCKCNFMFLMASLLWVWEVHISIVWQVTSRSTDLDSTIETNFLADLFSLDFVYPCHFDSDAWWYSAGRVRWRQIQCLLVYLRSSVFIRSNQRCPDLAVVSTKSIKHSVARQMCPCPLKFFIHSLRYWSEAIFCSLRYRWFIRFNYISSLVWNMWWHFAML